MIRVSFDPTQLTAEQQEWWQAWTERADEATTEVITAWEQWLDDGAVGKFKPDFDEDIWKDLRDWLLVNVFNKKCAYCETPMVRARHHGEHFRPKGQVRFRPIGAARLKPGITVAEWHEAEPDRLTEVPHPGYFWLAYNWKNIVPACEFCNTAQGKKDQFPINARHVAAKRITDDVLAGLREQNIRSTIESDLFYLQPDDLDVFEDRLLLHPYFDEPSEHLVFSEIGVVAPRHDSPHGLHSIAVYDLNGDDLVHARASLLQLVFTQYLSVLTVPRPTLEDRKQAGKAFLEEYQRKGEPYSAAVVETMPRMLASLLT